MEEQKVFKTNNQNIFVENREKISITNVEEVENFNEDIIVVLTARGLVTVKGSNLHIKKLDLEEGNVIIKGVIDALNYTNKESMGEKGKGLFSKVFK